MNKKKHLRMDSADCNNQNISFQDVMNMQFILLCNARGIARRFDGVSASAMLPEKEQKCQDLWRRNVEEVDLGSKCLDT